MVRIPQLKNIETAIKVYYSRIELSNSDIKELFGNLSSATIAKLKKSAKEKMIEENIPAYDISRVRTDSAFRAWGLEIKDLEKRLEKLKKLNLIN